MNLPIELKTRIYEHIGIVQQHLGELPSDEQREILQSLETHIHDALENRAGGEPSMEFLEAILAEMDPPESYGSEHHPAATQSHPDKETPTLSSIKARRNPAKRVILAFVIVFVSFTLIMAGIYVCLTLWAIARPSIEQPSSSDVISEGVGFGSVRLGTTREELTRLLGTPDPHPRKDHMLWKAKYIECVTGDRGIQVVRFRRGHDGTTSAGIRMGSTEYDLLAAYGEPETTHRFDDVKALEWKSKGVGAWLTPKEGVHEIYIFKPW